MASSYLYPFSSPYMPRSPHRTQTKGDRGSHTQTSGKKSQKMMPQHVKAPLEERLERIQYSSPTHPHLQGDLIQMQTAYQLRVDVPGFSVDEIELFVSRGLVKIIVDNSKRQDISAVSSDQNKIHEKQEPSMSQIQEKEKEGQVPPTSLSTQEAVKTEEPRADTVEQKQEYQMTQPAACFSMFADVPSPQPPKKSAVSTDQDKEAESKEQGSPSLPIFADVASDYKQKQRGEESDKLSQQSQQSSQTEPAFKIEQQGDSNAHQLQRKYLMRERPFGRATRIFAIPRDAQEKCVSARLVDGVLLVEIGRVQNLIPIQFE